MKKQKYDPKYVTPYKITDVMKDPAYYKHFLYRFNVAKEKVEVMGKGGEPSWYKDYKDNPKGCLEYSLDWITRKLYVCTHHAKTIKPEDRPKGQRPPIDSIILPACSDWITEKTGRAPEFEIPSNYLKSQRDYNFESYGPEKRRKREIAERKG